MIIHTSNTDPSILENVDHLSEAEAAMSALHPGKFDNYELGIVLRALVRSIEVLQHEVAEMKGKKHENPDSINTDSSSSGHDLFHAANTGDRT